MSEWRRGGQKPEVDWDPRSPDVLADQIAAYDEMRSRCPVPYSRYGNWAVLRHADAIRVVSDHETFSNMVSRHVSVPNGMDPPEHTPFRAVVDRYFTQERMEEFEPVCRRIASDLVGTIAQSSDIEFIGGVAEPFANRAQCAFMGWPSALHEPLRDWTKKNQRATLAMDRELMSAVAVEFDGYIREQLDERRAAGADAPDDVTTRLLGESIADRPLTDDEIVSIVRNWTVGELATIAASVGIVAHYLAVHRDVQDRLRADTTVLEAASDEILRIHAPLVANRRRTTRDVVIADRAIPADERVVVVWASANRDEAVFGDPDEFRLDRDPSENLLYGRGVHACPGAPLARLELRTVLGELLAATTVIEPGNGEPTRGSYPASGFTTLPLTIR